MTYRLFDESHCAPRHELAGPKGGRVDPPAFRVPTPPRFPWLRGQHRNAQTCPGDGAA